MNNLQNTKQANGPGFRNHRFLDEAKKKRIILCLHKSVRKLFLAPQDLINPEIMPYLSINISTTIC
jgi:hypothetical protein